MTFIDEHNHVLARVVAALLLGGGQKLVDDGEDDPLFALTDPARKIPPRGRLGTLSLFPRSYRTTESARR